MKSHNQLYRYVCLLALTVSGCRKEAPPRMLGVADTNGYGVVYTEGVPGFHDSGNLSLYQYSNGMRVLLYSQLVVGEYEVADDLVIFNGVADDQRRSLFYPALFGYAGSGTVVELSQPLNRKIATNGGFPAYSFRQQHRTNNSFVFVARQIPPENTNYPIYFPLILSEKELRLAVAEAQTNGLPATRGGVKFKIAK